ncbi:MAG: hypothetical protein GY849_04560, partial [Deltaproteobacteria bacterium]|nr:hypothetical protein [Deltaproteobacteria bacterium]
RALEVFPRAIRMELKAVGLEQFQSTQDFLHIRIQTRLLKGSRWRLWIQPVVPPESFGKIFRAEALSWTARPPFISHSLFPNEKAIVGQGRIDGRTVEGRLIWRAGNGAQAAGEYRGRVMLILEELP